MAGLSADLWAIHDRVQPLQPVEPPGLVATPVFGLDRNGRRAGRAGHRFELYQGASLGSRRKRGAKVQAIGPSRGGQTTKVHALTDLAGRPYVFVVTPGNVADITVAPWLITAMPAGRETIGDKGYDANSLRSLLKRRGTTAVIPSRSCRKVARPFDAETYKDRNVIERMFCRIKDYRRIATRYDKLAQNFLAALCLVAALCYWIN